MGICLAASQPRVQLAVRSKGACSEYVLDTAAATFGTCKCGYSKEAHQEKEENKASAALARE